jgi:hypothetical protein
MLPLRKQHDGNGGAHMKGGRLAALLLGAVPLCGCESFVESGEIQGIVKTNDLSIVMRMNGASNRDGTIE